MRLIIGLIALAAVLLLPLLYVWLEKRGISEQEKRIAKFAGIIAGFALIIFLGATLWPLVAA